MWYCNACSHCPLAIAQQARVIPQVGQGQPVTSLNPHNGGSFNGHRVTANAQPTPSIPRKTKARLRTFITPVSSFQLQVSSEFELETLPILRYK